MTQSGELELDRPEPSYQPNRPNHEGEEIQQATDLEATELEDYSNDVPAESSLLRETSARTTGSSTTSKPSKTGFRLRRVVTEHPRPEESQLRKFWRHHVRISVYHEDCRDHFALERTYLGYLRTSVALAMIGVTIAQLFRLDRNPDPVDDLDFYKVGKPLASLFLIASILVILLGAARFWRLQNAMIRSKVRAAGWELHVLTALVAAILLVVLVIVVNVDVTIDRGKVPNPPF